MAPSDVIQLVLIRYGKIYTYLTEAWELIYWITNALGKSMAVFIK